MRHAPLLPLAIALLVAACASSATPSPPPPSPTALPTQAASPSPSPSATNGQSATPAPSMTPEEASLVGAIRVDAATGCVPRRNDLPEGSLYAIECYPDDPLVERVGVYQFSARNDAAAAYMSRMASYGVDPNAGDCGADEPGDSAWTPGDGEGDVNDPDTFVWEGVALVAGRVGCFLDEFGTANVRASCETIYVGVLGGGTDLSDLHAWTWEYPEGYEVGTPDPPGLCIGQDIVDAVASAAP